jgi:Ca-activated chloride channel family protein
METPETGNPSFGKHPMNKSWIVAFFAGLLLWAGVWAQDAPNSPGSQTVARPRKNPNTTNPDTSTATPPSSGDAADAGTGDQKIPSKLSPKATKGKDADADTDASFKAESNLVSVDVQVLDPNGNPIPNLPRGYFRILEDNVPQTLQQFSTSEAPMTVAMVIEFSARFQSYYSMGWRDTLNDVYGFFQTLKKDDYVAIIAYDLRTTILSDFTADRSKTAEALQRLRIPGFSESNMFDAVSDTADRMSKIEGRRAILLVTSGIDTFSKLTYDKTRKILQEAGVPVYSISILQAARAMGNDNITFLQGDNELRTFAKETGGQAFFPRFQGEMPGVFRNISQSLRNQYQLSYSPNNQARDGKFRKLTVQLVNPQTGEPLKMVDDKTKKNLKYTIIAKAGYVAPRAVE